MKYALFVGRWQPFHDGHKWLVEQQLSQGKNVLLAIRDVEPTENQPFTASEVLEMIKTIYTTNRVVAIIIPDIESINYGRGVGYEVIEHKPNQSIEAISATDIRNKIRCNDPTWKDLIDPKIHSLVEAVVNGE
jgi:cytidyltransferase-like protein